MPLRDLLKKKDDIKNDAVPPITAAPLPTADQDSPPEFTFLRSDTNTQELIKPPNFPGDRPPSSSDDHYPSKRFSRLRSSSNASQASHKSERRLSQRLRLSSHSRTSSQSSVNVPLDLPDIQDVGVHGEDREAQWEERATILARENPNNRPMTLGMGSRPTTPGTNAVQHSARLGEKSERGRSISDAKSDDDIQEAIRLHEAGDLLDSTAMFGRLADNNAMAQILYGLALRHGWGIDPNPELAIAYLSRAASSSASVESDALQKGARKGGAAKGELVLAIYELANSFRHGWGVGQDPVAARKYYEVAANLGDTDAMNEVARCYENGYGGKKDRYTAAQYYRLAEENGSKTLGNSWIWKDKYAPPPKSKGDMKANIEGKR